MINPCLKCCAGTSSSAEDLAPTIQEVGEEDVFEDTDLIASLKPVDSSPVVFLGKAALGAADRRIREDTSNDFLAAHAAMAADES